MASARRTLVLMSVLLALVAVYLFRYGPFRPDDGPAPWKPLPGNPEVSALQVQQLPNGHWKADFDYYYTGRPGWGLVLVKQVGAREGAAQPPLPPLHVAFRSAEQGRHHVSVEITRPTEEAVHVTREIDVTLTQATVTAAGRQDNAVASQKVAVNIEWPTFYMMRVNDMVAAGTPEQVVADQALKIDTEGRDEIKEARDVLERLLQKSPQTDSAYIELARVAMKTNWGPEGLNQAERLLDSARQIRADNPNMKILLGYVYAHQKRYTDAEALFADAAQAAPPNLWLWFNWGELLEMQGRASAAAEKYKVAVAQPARPSESFDKARRASFDRLIELAQERRDLDAAEALHKQRTTDYGLTNCYGPAYARFMLYQRQDAQAAMDLARKMADVRCPAGDVNEIMGVANYMLWAGAKEPERAEMLRQARVQFPAGPKLFYRLASSDKMVPIARQLVASGDKVDQPDNAKLTALAYALTAKDSATAARLLRIGARADAPVGAEDIPAALIPVVNRDFESIKVLQRAGVNYATIKFRGLTAFDHARQTQDRALLDALEPRGKSL